MTLRTSILLLLGSLATCPASPVGMALSSDGAKLFIALKTPPSIAVVESATGKLTQTWNLPAIPQGVTLSADGSRLLVPAGIAPGKLLTLNAADGNVISSSNSGHSPKSVATGKDGAVFVCDQFENRVYLTNESSIPVIREPVAAVCMPDGGTLFVANLLPAGRADSGRVSAEISVIDIVSNQSSTIVLPNGSTDLRALALSPDARFLYAVHTLARYALPTTQLDRGWMNTSALSVIDAAQRRLVTTVLLDDIDRGAANPSGVACSHDGKLLAVSHAGTHEVSLIDRGALHEKFARIERGEGVTESSKSLADLPNDLAFLHGIRRRIQLAGNGPRAVVATPEGFAAVCYFSRTLHLLKTGPDLTATIRDIALSPPFTEDDSQRGERLFFDATRCFQHWQSCATCHPDVRTDGLNWDLLNDGAGNPKQTKSLLFSIHTPPAMVSGIRPNAETAIRTGMRYILFGTQPEEDSKAIETFLRNLPAVPGPALVDGQTNPAAVRGREVFIQAACAKCHSGPYLTDGRSHDLGNGLGQDAGKSWDTPTLREIWRTAPYLHDGRAATLDDVLGSANPGDKHGHTSQLTADQRRDLIEFLRSQ